MVVQIPRLNRADLGYDKNGLCFAELKNCTDRYDFSPELETVRSYPEIEAAGGYYLGRIGGESENLLFSPSIQADKPDRNEFYWPTRSVGADYFEICRIPFLQGGRFSDPNARGCVINEAAAKRLGIQHPVGQNLDIMDLNIRAIPVVGVMKDTYEFISREATPLVYLVAPSPNRILYRYKPGTRNQVERKIKKMIETKVPAETPDFVYMEDVVNQQNKTEINFLKLLYILSSVCIAGSLFGAYAMVSLSCERRRKEIAIRKINGATVGVLLTLFLKKYLWLLVVASSVAFCAGAILMRSWLEQFIFRTTISFWIYPLVFISVAVILSLIVVLRIWKSIRIHPAEELK